MVASFFGNGNLIITNKFYSIITSHASIAYRKQLTPQRTVGIIGSVWQESTPSKETTGPAQINTQSETMKTNSRKWQTAHARPLLEPALANWF